MEFRLANKSYYRLDIGLFQISSEQNVWASGHRSASDELKEEKKTSSKISHSENLKLQPILVRRNVGLLYKGWFSVFRWNASMTKKPRSLDGIAAQRYNTL